MELLEKQNEVIDDIVNDIIKNKDKIKNLFVTYDFRDNDDVVFFHTTARTSIILGMIELVKILFSRTF